MPMGLPALSATDTDAIKAWIKAGASFDKGAPRKHWAYIAPVKPKVPELRSTWVHNPIDAFVLARLKDEHLRPSPEASRETLIRRVTLDLTGLPPTPQEVDAFVFDRRADAYDRLVDRLLASPHYGEKQAQGWLDLARYADTDGYEKDLRRTNWKYRDWVIDAFNRNLPYDQFTIDQIAGDMLPDATVDDRIATGFNRNTMFNREGGVNQQEAHFAVVEDRAETTATVWLGSTLGCARCHDHKYDPFLQRDYYKMVAFYNNTQVYPEGPQDVGEEKWFEGALSLPTPEQKSDQTRLVAKIASLQAEIKASASKEKSAELAATQKQLDALNGQIQTALTLAEKPVSGPLTEWVRHRGEFTSRTEQVTAGTPGVLPPLKTARADRLALAKWLVAKDNPLTARVEVNRLWEECFGRGIVETSEDFGTRGSPPTHPELLDWLACKFMSEDWNLKSMLRLIVTSATYRQSSDATPLLIERDPRNLLLARGPRFRLDAETIHDEALAASGLLSPKIGGPSVYPSQPEGIWDSPYSGDRWTLSQGDDRYRRGLYTFWKRTAPYPAYMAFDATSRETCTVRRIRTNTPLQALALLNDDFMMQASRALGKRMQRAGTNDPARLTEGFRFCTARRPKPAELTRLKALLVKLKTRYSERPKDAAKLGADPSDAAWVLVGNVLLNLDETITKG